MKLSNLYDINNVIQQQKSNFVVSQNVRTTKNDFLLLELYLGFVSYNNCKTINIILLSQYKQPNRGISSEQILTSMMSPWKSTSIISHCSDICLDRLTVADYYLSPSLCVTGFVTCPDESQALSHRVTVWVLF